MGRIVAIDYGKKRAGLAVSDPFGSFAVSLTAIDVNDIWKYLDEYMLREQVDRIVVGYPKTLRNEPSQALRYINPFIKKLRKRFPDRPIELFDERFTSSMAMQAMIEGGMPKMKRQEKKRIDPISAVIMLQGYLDLQNMRSKI